MDTYKNWIPIHFGEENIVLWKTGFSSETVLNKEDSVWNYCKGGIAYAWPTTKAGIPENGERVSIAPTAAPELAEAILCQMLFESLSPYLLNKESAKPESASWEVELEAIQARISLHSPPGYKGKSFLIVLPLDDTGGTAMLRSGKKLAKKIATLDFSNGADTAFNVLPYVGPENLGIVNLNEPQLNFRPGGVLTHTNKWRGLERYGPFSIDSTRGKHLHSLVLAPRRMMGISAQMIGELRDGLPQVNIGTYFPWPKPWSETFQFEKFSARQVPFENNSPEGIREFCAELIKSSNPKPDLVFVFLEEMEGDIPPGQDPYVLLKAEFLKYGIPTQMVRGATCRLPDTDRAKALRNIALGAFVKTGGRPWLLPRREFMKHELVLGIGATPLREGVAGFSMIFSRDGDFRLGNSSILPGIGDWQADLGQFVLAQIEQLAKEGNWQDHDQVELTFHFSEALGEPDVKAIREQIQNRLKDRFSLQLTFLFLQQQHDMRIWDPGMPGVGPTSPKTGEYQPKRGSFLIQDDENALLQLHKTEDQGLFNAPLRIYRHPESDNYDLNYLGEQIFRFSAISWRSMGHSPLPVTLEYGNSLTRLLEKFDAAGCGREVESSLLSHPQKTWFL